MPVCQQDSVDALVEPGFELVDALVEPGFHTVDPRPEPVLRLHQIRQTPMRTAATDRTVVTISMFTVPTIPRAPAARYITT